ncbi:hypothetical protein STEG23_000003 [Scotinomys teguina]
MGNARAKQETLAWAQLSGRGLTGKQEIPTSALTILISSHPANLIIPKIKRLTYNHSFGYTSSTKRALQFSHQTPRSEPGEEPPPLPEPGDPVPKPGEPPREPGELVPMPGDAGPGEPVKELGDEVPEPGDGVPDEPSAEPAPSGVGRLPERDSSYALRYQLSGEKGAAGLVGEHTSFTCRRDTQHQALRGHRSPS